MQTVVSAIIVNYHAAALVEQAVRSLLGQELDQGGVEVIVVDNSCSESERVRLDALAGPRVRLLFNDDNLGFGRACNRGFDVAAGEHILLLNPDAYLLPGALALLVRCLGEEPRAGAVSPRTFLDDGQRLLTPPSIMPSPMDEIDAALADAWPAWMKLQSHWHRFRSLRVLRNERPVPQSSLSGAHVLLRRVAVEASGGLFDPAFFMYFEDSDLFRRMRSRNWRLYLCPAARGVHYFDQCAHEHAGQKRRYGEQALQVFMDKYDPGGRGRKAARLLRSLSVRGRPVRYASLGPARQPPPLPVPPGLRREWVLEVSLNPRFVPAAVMIGSGESARIPPDAWERFAERPYFLRLGGRRRFFTQRTWCVEKVA